MAGVYAAQGVVEFDRGWCFAVQRLEQFDAVFTVDPVDQLVGVKAVFGLIGITPL